jgi:hypothetical protein
VPAGAGIAAFPRNGVARSHIDKRVVRRRGDAEDRHWPVPPRRGLSL